jgi:2,5-diketo-D-gluconate reductase A
MILLSMLLFVVVPVGSESSRQLPFVEASLWAAQQLNDACRDQHANCAEWATQGECVRNPSFMHSSCVQSCHACSDLLSQSRSAFIETAQYALRNAILAFECANRQVPPYLHQMKRQMDNEQQTPLKQLERMIREIHVELSAELFATLPTVCTLELDGDDDVNDNGILAKLRQLELESFASSSSTSANVIPMSGFGTWQVNGDQCRKTVADALRLGYRHLDTAQAYGNEREVGEAIAMSGIPRAELFVATKLSERRSFEDARTLVLSQLREMQLDYFDLYMLHSPHPSFEIELKAWRVLEQLHDEGLLRYLGVSNFDVAQLRELDRSARVKPVAVQNKFSVYHVGSQRSNTDNDVLAYCRANNKTLVAYSILNRWPFLLDPIADPHVLAIAHRLGCTPAQVLIRWTRQHGAAVLLRSTKEQHMREDLEASVASMQKSLDMALLDSLSWLSRTNDNQPVTKFDLMSAYVDAKRQSKQSTVPERDEL